jgi:hypothetical protein
MNKAKLDISSKEPKNFIFNNQKIEVLPYIVPSRQLELIRNYIALYFTGSVEAENRLSAEWGLILQLMDSQTNVSVFEEVDSVSLDSIITSGLWDEIQKYICNYEDLLENLYFVVGSMKDSIALDKSVGSILQNVSDKVLEFVDKISELDLSKEGVQELVNKFQEANQDFQQKYMNAPEEKPVKKIRRKATG